MSKGDLLVAFEAYKHTVARAMIDGGEGARVRQVLERLRFEDYEAGWHASRASLIVELPPGRSDMTAGALHLLSECKKRLKAIGIHAV